MTHIETIENLLAEYDMTNSAFAKDLRQAIDAATQLKESSDYVLREQAQVRSTDEQAQSRSDVQPVATVSIEHFRGLKSMENVEFQLMTDMPVGSHLLYTAPPTRQPDPVIDKSAAIRIATALGWTPPRPATELRKPWVGLTDEEIHKVAFDIDGKEPNAHIKFTRAIEVKLKAKNSP